MKTRGDFSLSFGIIFSIFIIAAVIAVAGYAIMHFLSLKNCTELGLYGRDLQNKLDRAWNADSVEGELFSGIVPWNVKKVCIGDISQAPKDSEEYKALRRFSDSGSNLFFYPIPSSCDIIHMKLEHAMFKQKFECVDVENGRATLRLDKGSFDSLVNVCGDKEKSCSLQTGG